MNQFNCDPMYLLQLRLTRKIWSNDTRLGVRACFVVLIFFATLLHPTRLRIYTTQHARYEYEISMRRIRLIRSKETEGEGRQSPEMRNDCSSDF